MYAILDAGHEPGVDNGACYGRLKEAVVNRNIRLACYYDLLKNGIKNVKFVPDFGGWLKSSNLNKKIRWINENSSTRDLLVSIHINSIPKTNMPDLPSGVEVWGYKGLPCMDFYNSILNGVIKETGIKNRGVKDEQYGRYGQFGIVHNTNPTACIVECGFLQGDYELLAKEPYRFGWGISHGLINYLNLIK